MGNSREIEKRKRSYQSTFHPINRNHNLRSILQRINQRTQPHRTTPNKHYDTFFDDSRTHVLEGVLGGEIAGWEDVGHENEFPFVDAGGCCHGGGVGEGDAEVFCLPAREIGGAEEEGFGAAGGDLGG